MRRGQKIALSIALVIGGSLAMCKLAYPTYTYRYKMTVNVEADGKLYSGSSVIEVRLVKQMQLTTEMPPVATEVSGEAVFADLGGGRNVIALLASGNKAKNSEYPKYIVSEHFKLSYDDSDLVKFPRLRGRWELPSGELPTFVTFTDLADPKTARVVGLTEFEAVFGPDVHFKGVSVEMTSDPVTRGIEKNLKWWNNPGRPVSEARRAWLAGDTTGPSIEPETLFKRN
jgi:hypothetical protein